MKRLVNIAIVIISFVLGYVISNCVHTEKECVTNVTNVVDTIYYNDKEFYFDFPDSTESLAFDQSEVDSLRMLINDRAFSKSKDKLTIAACLTLREVRAAFPDSAIYSVSYMYLLNSPLMTTILFTTKKEADALANRIGTFY